MNDSLYEWNVKIMHVDPESPLAEDLKKLKDREGKDHVLLSFIFKVRKDEVAPFARRSFIQTSCHQTIRSSYLKQKFGRVESTTGIYSKLVSTNH